MADEPYEMERLPDPHDHPPADDTSPPSHYELMTLAMKELLTEQGTLSNDEIRAQLERIDSWKPARGAAMVARAWTDPEFRARLLEDASIAVREFGIDPGGVKLICVENTESVQNVIVCTLCSCYPRAILGLPPDWYKSKAYRSRVVIEPREVLREFGTEIPDDVTVAVHDSLATLRYLVLPVRPPGTEGWSEEQLAEIVTRDTMVGVTNPKVPADG
jgi:nitrile hydratase